MLGHMVQFGAHALNSEADNQADRPCLTMAAVLNALVTLFHGNAGRSLYCKHGVYEWCMHADVYQTEVISFT